MPARRRERLVRVSCSKAGAASMQQQQQNGAAVCQCRQNEKGRIKNCRQRFTKRPASAAAAAMCHTGPGSSAIHCGRPSLEVHGNVT
jgi:hypothetical protein